MRNKTKAAVVLASLVVLAAARCLAAGEGTLSEEKKQRCNDKTLQGTWGIQVQGSLPPAPGAPSVPFIGIVLREYDGHGNFSQVDNVKTPGGATLDRPGFGTYAVNPDCTAIVLLDTGSGIVIEERMVLVDGGRGAFAMVADPLPLMVTAVHRKVRD